MDSRILKRIKQRDRLARWIITVGGMAIIFSVILILFLIVRVTLPLFQDPRTEVFARFTLPPDLAEEVIAAGIDEYLESGLIVTRSGDFVSYDLRSAETIGRDAALPPGDSDADVAAVEPRGDTVFGFLWSDGSFSIEEVGYRTVFDAEGKRSLRRALTRLAAFPPPLEGMPRRSTARGAEESRVRADLFPDGRLRVHQESVTSDFLGEEEIESHTFFLEEAASRRVSALTLDSEGRFLYAGTEDGGLLRWSLEEPGSPVLLDQIEAFSDGRAITALELVLGDISLAVGDAKGGVSTWFPVSSAQGKKELRRIHDLTRHAAPVVQIRPSQRDKSILSLGAGGILHLDHMTSERHLLTLAEGGALEHFAFSARGNGILALDAQGNVTVWTVNNPHPEISLRTLFGKVWYESYDAPAHVWQSSAATDDFEPKLSLTPLIFGTLKGTFYAMLFAVPLALFGAIYTSQFGSARMRELVKPTVEIMAAVPSVVIGFLAALWLAPLLEANIAGLFLSLGFLPAAFVLALVVWQGVRRYEPLKRVERGYEFLALLPVILLAGAIAFALGPLFERLVFDGNFRQWLYDHGGIRYDQRNSIVIGFALGFAVIPIIFTIAEDSLSNVPKSLRAASLALGASRWQTVWRVILPSASPGIFAAIMIGFGRAIGETMIVLMATGNTAVMDWSIFNGMRPLSSNIAVEIPEAPFGGTLYRILFLSAVILFTLTFILNTVAEIVRQRLRKKYGRF